MCPGQKQYRHQDSEKEGQPEKHLKHKCEEILKKKKKRQKQNTFECNLKSQRRVSGYQTGKMFHSCSFQLRSILYATLDKQDCLKAVPDSLSNMFLNGKSSQILNIS